MCSAAPRLREPKRDQVELRAMDVDSLIGEDHVARVLWTYVEGLDLSNLENRIKARVTAVAAGALALCDQPRRRQRPALERLCNSHDAPRWLCGITKPSELPADVKLLAEIRDHLAVIAARAPRPDSWARR